MMASQWENWWTCLWKPLMVWESQTGVGIQRLRPIGSDQKHTPRLSNAIVVTLCSANEIMHCSAQTKKKQPCPNHADRCHNGVWYCHVHDPHGIFRQQHPSKSKGEPALIESPSIQPAQSRAEPLPAMWAVKIHIVDSIPSGVVCMNYPTYCAHADRLPEYDAHSSDWPRKPEQREQNQSPPWSRTESA